jgi:hypothetical protein
MTSPENLGPQFSSAVEGAPKTEKSNPRTVLYHGSTHTFDEGEDITPQGRGVVPWKTSISDKHGALAWATKDPSYAVGRATLMGLKQETVTGEFKHPRLYTVEHIGEGDELQNIEETKGDPFHYASPKGFRITGELMIPNFSKQAKAGLAGQKQAVNKGKIIPASEEPYVCKDCNEEMPKSKIGDHFTQKMEELRPIRTALIAEGKSPYSLPVHKPEAKYKDIGNTNPPRIRRPE